MKSRIFNVSVVSIMVGLCLTLGTATASDNYPSRSIEYVVGWGAGGGSDTFARVINIPVRRSLKTNVAVVNMPGAASAVAMEYVQQQPADGYTIFGCTSELVSNQLQGRSKYTYKDFTPILRAHVDVGTIQAIPNENFKNWNEFLAFAKKSSRKVRLGGTGAASFDQIASYVILDSAGITDKVTYIPYESAGEMHASLMGGHIDAIYEEPGVTLDLIEAGKMILLIVFTDKRLEKFPDTPAAGELGYDVPPMLWRGIMVKKGTPQEIVDKLEQVYIKAMQTSTYKSFEKDRLLTLFPGFLDSKDFQIDLSREYKLYQKAVQKLGLTN